MNKEDGKFKKGVYHTIPETKNISLPINENHIMLGIKVTNEKGIEYPKELPYFVCPKEIKDVFGEEPTELTVFFPSNKREEVFPQAYEKYGSNNALLCQGDGDVSKTAQRLNLENGRWEDVVCPCEHFKKWDPKTKTGGCSKVGHLRFMIPSVSIGTFYQCSPHGTVSIQELNSAFELADKTTGGHWAMIPFRMKRVAKKLKIPGTANMKTHWVVTLEVAASTEEIRRVIAGEILYLGQLKDGVYQLEAPELPLANRAYVAEETDEEEAAREEKIKEAKKAESKEIKEGRAREAQLKKDREEGKGKLKSYKESKTIYKKRVEEEDKILQAISKKAQKAGIDSFEGLVDFALDRGIIKTKLTEHIARRVLATNKDVRDRLLKALEEFPTPKKEMPKKDKEKLFTDLFSLAQKAGFKNWEEIVGEGCRTKISNEEYIFDIPTTIEEAKEMLIDDPERLRKMKEIFKVMAEAIDLG